MLKEKFKIYNYIWIHKLLTMKKNVMLLILIVITYFYCDSQVRTHSNIGVLLNDAFNVIGTGFVVEEPNYVLTCHHNINKLVGNIYFRPIGDSINHLIYSLKQDSMLDLSLFASSEMLTSKPLIICKIRSN